MRGIEFRAWDKNTRIMYQPEKIHNIYFWNGESEDVVTNGLIPHGCNDIELMQYTGLKDKNRVKIYEGDIVKVRRCGYPDVNSEVKFERCCLVFIGIGFITTFSYTSIEVIGNIYENSHLIDNNS